MQKKVEVIIGKDGSIKVEAFGFKGGTCEEATAFIENLFGDPEDKKYKPSYYEQAETLVNGLPSGWCG